MTATTPPNRLVAPQGDAALLHAASGGAVDAFRELFERHADAIRAYLVARLGPHAANDVLIETFVAAWRARSSFRLDADSARPWLYGIATIQAKRHHAAEARWQRSAHAERESAEAERPAELAVEPCSPALARALASLSPKEREILLLVALGDLTIAMAARAAGISAVAARMRLHRARRRVADHLATTEGADDA